jgi:hypothetical protein
MAAGEMGLHDGRFREGLREPVEPETDVPADPPPLSLRRFCDRAGWSGKGADEFAGLATGSGIVKKIGSPTHVTW